MSNGPSPPLYRQLLGAAWSQLDEAVRRAHSDGGLVYRVGQFQFRTGISTLAKILLTIMRFPCAGEGIATKLMIMPIPHGEQWTRTFGNKKFVTTQAVGADGVLIERFGMVELQFELEVVRAALKYRQKGAGFRLGPVAFAIPQRFSPQIEALESADGHDGVQVSVVVRVPLIGLLMSYNGRHVQEPLP
jgi:hypothetical protein